MSKKIVGTLLSAVIGMTMLVGCGGGNTTTTPSTTPTESVEPSDATEPAGEAGYAGDLTLMHFSTTEESQGNGGSDGFRTMIAEWKEANPNINLTENVLANDEYKTQIATFAAAGDLPDVFLVQGMNVKQWASQGLIMDMTDVIANSPDNANYNEAMFTPFKDEEGKVYGIPALTGGTCTVVVYDKQLWKDAGFDTFPTTWDEVLKAKDYFSGEGMDTIAFGNSGKWQANSCFVSTVGNMYTGKDWFQSIIDKAGAKFTDQTFVDALTFTQEAFQSGVFNVDFNAISNEDAREYYISGDAAAFIGGNWDVSYIMATLLEADEEKYNNIGFATFPTPDNAKGLNNAQNIGMGYAVAINSKVKDDPEKLAAAIDLAYKLTGSDFSNFVASKYALSGIVKVENVDLSAFDEVTQAFYNYSYVDTNACEIYDSYVNGAVWDIFNTELQNMLNGDTPAQTVAEKTQAAYEANY